MNRPTSALASSNREDTVGNDTEPRGDVESRLLRAARLGFCTVYLVGAGVHVGIATTNAETYRPFAEQAVPLIREAWTSTFMVDPRFWGLAVAAGEFMIGVLLLGAGVRALVGVVMAIGFHLALLLFGWWTWIYAIPALAVLAWMARTVRPGRVSNTSVAPHSMRQQGR
jgi:hypothetical protein